MVTGQLMAPYVRVAATSHSDPAQAAAELREQLGTERATLVWFFAGSQYDFAALAEEMHRAANGARTVGCTTCGEIGPAGCTVGGVSALALYSPCRAAAVLVDDMTSFRFEDGGSLLTALARQLGTDPQTVLQSPDAYAFVTLTDGLSGQEEILIAALGTYAPKVGLIGGSAADDFRFVETLAAVDGRAVPSSAAVVLLEPGAPFSPFHLHHYEPSDESVVVTDAEPERRLLRRIDGRPAIETLCRLMGIDEQRLRRKPLDELRDHPVVFGIRAADDIFLRSVMNVKGDALLMGGAVEDGTVLWPMNAGDLVSVTSAGIADALRGLEQPAGMLLFNCGGRMWEAMGRERECELASAMQPIPAAGFTTYGEQYGPLQVNHTLTGLAFGVPDDR